MILTLLFSVLAIGFIVLLIVCNYKDYYGLGYFAVVGTTITSIIAIVMIIVSVCTAIAIDGYRESKQQEYISLRYQAENNLYDSNEYTSKKELVDQITKWNQEVTKGKINQDNIWVSWFYPHIYNDLKLIPIGLIK